MHTHTHKDTAASLSSTSSGTQHVHTHTHTQRHCSKSFRTKYFLRYTTRTHTYIYTHTHTKTLQQVSPHRVLLQRTQHVYTHMHHWTHKCTTRTLHYFAMPETFGFLLKNLTSLSRAIEIDSVDTSKSSLSFFFGKSPEFNAIKLPDGRVREALHWGLARHLIISSPYKWTAAEKWWVFPSLAGHFLVKGTHKRCYFRRASFPPGTLMYSAIPVFLQNIHFLHSVFPSQEFAIFLQSNAIKWNSEKKKGWGYHP